MFFLIWKIKGNRELKMRFGWNAALSCTWFKVLAKIFWKFLLSVGKKSCPNPFEVPFKSFQNRLQIVWKHFQILSQSFPNPNPSKIIAKSFQHAFKFHLKCFQKPTKILTISFQNHFKYTWPGSNWRPSACGADVIATRPQVLVFFSRNQTCVGYGKLPIIYPCVRTISTHMRISPWCVMSKL